MCLVLMSLSDPLAAASPSKLVGLGLHQETGRDIYLGALYIPQNASRPSNLQTLSGPRTMEYRIVARRTSIRSLLGSILLQSEIATGQPPSDNTAEFADALLSGVKSSLYTGDILAISLTSDNQTVAALNDYTLATSDDPEVANYILIGWLQEGGATTAFREALLDTSIDSQLQSRLKATEPDAQRRAEIAAWITPGIGEDASATQSETATTPTLEIAAETSAPTTDDATPVAAQPPNEKTETVAIAEEVNIDQDAAAQTKSNTAPHSPGPAGESSQEALTAAVNDIDLSLQAAPQNPPLGSLDDLTSPDTSLSLTSQDLGGLELDSEILALGVQEYSRRLSAFHGDLVARVYRAIKYPKRAIRRSLQGRLELDITLRESGELVSVTVAESSGHSLLDDAALEAAETAMREAQLSRLDRVAVAEFGGRGGRVVVPVPVNFQLERN